MVASSPVSGDDFVVTRPLANSNVGSNLASLAAALWLAQRLDRALIIDWRGMSQLVDKSLNYFTEYFAFPEEFRGVRVLHAPVAEATYEKDSAEAGWPAIAEVSRLARGAPAKLPRFLVLSAYHGPERLMPEDGIERFAWLRSFCRRLQPAAGLATEIERWAQQNLDGAFVVGLNVRTGNGQYFAKGMPYYGRVDVSIFRNETRLLRVLERACRKRARGLPGDVSGRLRIFYATDSAPMSQLLSRLPGATTRRSLFPPPGTGDTFCFPADDGQDRRAVRDTIADMFLLARCDALVYNQSAFNQYARVLTANFSGNLVHVERLFLRYWSRVLLGSARRRLARLASRIAGRPQGTAAA
jgi:hypothetical protein